jgi:hypothetical protein
MKNNNKILIFSGIIILVLTLFLISNTEASEGDLWNVVNAIRTGVGHLQDRVLVLESAPQNTLHLEDASGQDLGILFEANPGSTGYYRTIFPEGDWWMAFTETSSSQTIAFGNHHRTYYENLNCAGPIYVWNFGSSNNNRLVENNETFYKGVNRTDNITILSQVNVNSIVCENITPGPPETLWLAEEVDAPFEFPLVFPLKIVVK